ncbi:MAG: hypothetical protein J5870_06555 [Clostridia bacterium]|nr:hypothetical protein [Clostridia bacterium]
MAGEYRHIKQYEEELLKLRKDGLTLREIGERFGFTYEQMHEFFKRYNRKQRKLAAVIPLEPKGRTRKGRNSIPPSVQQLSKLTQLQYEMASKDRYIKRLEIENELMRDFLSLTERK